ncbi:hypothetical protein M0G43_03710 [Subsaxibacter sp. CAU 1640]|uniref:hypothetical protein n=1 Tax=Subsaxibacter sp. CAU 1640 TaxID=2933271 RepID=UPI002004E06A|nr:hypothetical protein [Subsaxibacter sp. CAU 1640]MCK7589669.1 hypothetical protein [Subsaxibacter sp. CAU 1640]
MEISEWVITMLITVLSLFPFVWFTYLGKKRMSKGKKAINELTNAQNLNFNVKEQWNNSFIGIDEQQKVLFYAKVKSTENESLRIDLNKVKLCKIHKEVREFKREKKVESELQKLDLELELYGKSNLTVNLYDIDDNLSEDFEMKRAELWQKLIFKNIPKMTASSSAA